MAHQCCGQMCSQFITARYLWDTYMAITDILLDDADTHFHKCCQSVGFTVFELVIKYTMICDIFRSHGYKLVIRGRLQIVQNSRQSLLWRFTSCMSLLIPCMMSPLFTGREAYIHEEHQSFPRFHFLPWNLLMSFFTPWLTKDEFCTLDILLFKMLQEAFNLHIYYLWLSCIQYKGGNRTMEVLKGCLGSLGPWLNFPKKMVSLPQEESCYWLLNDGGLFDDRVIILGSSILCQWFCWLFCFIRPVCKESFNLPTF